MTEENFSRCLVTFTNSFLEDVRYICNTYNEYLFVTSNLPEHVKKTLLVRRIYTVEGERNG